MNLRKIFETAEIEKELLEGLFNQSLLGIVLMDRQYNILKANTKFIEIFGFSKEEAIGENIEDLIVPPENRKLYNRYKKILLEDGSFNGEVIRQSKSGERKYYNLNTLKINLADDITVVYALYEDIDEKKKEEKEIRILSKAMLNISDSVVITDKNFKIIKTNKQTEKLFGYTFEELKGQTPDIFNAEEDSVEIQTELYDTIAQGNTFMGESLNKRKDGSTFICEYKITPMFDEFGEHYAYIGIQRDITERKEAAQKLCSQFKIEQAVADISSNFINSDIEDISEAINYALEKIGKSFGIDRSYIFEIDKQKRSMSNTYEWCAKGIEAQKENLQDLPSNNFSWWMEKLQKDDFISIPDIDTMDEEAVEEKTLLKKQEIKSLLVLPMKIKGEIFGFFGFDSVKRKRNFNDSKITLLKVLTEIISNAFSKHISDKKIKELTFKDRLTGLYNRSFVAEEMQRLDSSRQLPISIIMIDINGLKLINDSYGHEKGDQLIKSTAELIKTTFRREDIMARWGGDEFVVFLPKTDKDTALRMMERLEEGCKSKAAAGRIPLSIGIGFAVKERQCEDINFVINKADENMYQDKLRKGKEAKNAIVNRLLKDLADKSFSGPKSKDRIRRLAEKISEKIALTQEQKNDLMQLIDLYHIGETSIPTRVLQKPEKLNKEEWELIKKHPEKGAAIIKSTDSFSHLAKYIKHHHENWDGSGYPDGLAEDEIPLFSRIIHLLDAYDVMLSGRPYKKALSKNEAVEELKRNSSLQFDPKLVNSLLEIVGKN